MVIQGTREFEGFSDPVVLESLAYGIREICRAANRRKPQGRLEPEERIPMARAASFLRRAVTGVQLKERRAFSVTPHLDLLAEDFTRRATVKIYADAGNGKFSALLASLTQSFEDGAETGTFTLQKPWDYTHVAKLWSELFDIVSVYASEPTDVSVREPMQ